LIYNYIYIYILTIREGDEPRRGEDQCTV
jgi:hypothetical protein